MNAIKKKKEAPAAPAYLFMFCLFLVLAIIVVYLLDMARFMTMQHHIDDALADAVLASMVVDEHYYFETQESERTPVIRFNDKQESYNIYKECLADSIAETPDFYHNFEYDQFILYELEDGDINVTTYLNDGTYTTNTQSLGGVTTPGGENVTKTSVYGKVAFDIQSNLVTIPQHKSREIYCVFNLN